MTIQDDLLARTQELLLAVDQLLLGRTLAAVQTFKSETADADPGAGAFRFNNASVSAVTEIYFDDEEVDGTSMASLLLSYDDSTSQSKGRLTLTQTGTAVVWATFRVTGAVVSAAGYKKVPVEYIDHNGTFVADETYSHSFYESGDAGDPPSFAIGTVTEGSPAAGNIVLDNGVYKLNLTLPVGAVGLQGPQGETGATIHMIAGVPDDAVGNDGDVWIDTSNILIHGPKASGTWPAGISFRGATGAQGATGLQGPTGATGPAGPQGPIGNPGTNGATIHPTTGQPADTVGEDGDYAFDPANGNGYGPKASGSWAGTEYSITGPQGVQGPTGPQGATGPAGPQGEQGIVGPAGVDGRTVHATTGQPAESFGVNGDFALDLANNLAYGPKAGGAWPAGVSIKGEQGDQGDQGVQGEQGFGWLSGLGTPSNGLGRDGDFYIDLATSAYYGPKASGTWPGSSQSLVGPQGPVGPEGPEGPVGPQGPAGDGDVDGPDGGVLDGQIVLFNGTTGKLIKGSGKSIADVIADFDSSIQGLLAEAQAASASAALVTGPRPIQTATAEFTTFDFPVNTVRQLIDTTTHPLDGVLPETPVLGDETSFIDIGDFSANSFFVRRNGNPIGGTDEDMEVNRQNAFATLRWVGLPTGWKVTAV